MLMLIQEVEICNPGYRGKGDIFIVNDRILQIAERIVPPGGLGEVRTLPGKGLLAVPGFIDQHVHLIGGGGEGGPTSRTPEIKLSQLTTAGITTVVGLLGVDGVTRHMADLLAKARSLELEGISTYIYTGAYQLPTRTLTGSVRSDLVLIDKVLGTGEIALSDHRSAQPSVEELAHLAAESRVGGLIGGKPGIVHLHIGLGKERLNQLFEVVNRTDLPITQMVPTHVNRSGRLFEQAMEFVRTGGWIDLTAGITPENDSPESLATPKAIRLLVDEDIPLERVTMSSDGNGSLPRFDNGGNLVGMEVGSVKVLWEDICKAVKEEGVPLETALRLITVNPARLLGLHPQKGTVSVGADADLVLLTPSLEIDTVIAKGKVMVQGGQAIVKGTFEE